MPYILNIPSSEKLRVRGRCRVAGANPFEIPLPQLPSHGAWSVRGKVLAFDPGATAPATSASIAFLISIAGNSADGTVLETDGLSPPYTVFPGTGGLPVTVRSSITNQVLVLKLHGGRPGAVVWGWDIELDFVSKPFQ